MSGSDASTPTGVRIVAVDHNGVEHNVTEGVQVLYDSVIQSMDWGSGFLSVEDVRPIVEVAKLCGFKGFEEAEDYMRREEAAEKRRSCEHPSWHREPSPGGGPYSYAVCDECGLTRIV